MKPEAHSFEDKLLELAYDELPDHEARAVEAHLSGCSRCSDALASIRGVRQTMGQVPVVQAPEAGLESLLAYAEQAARRAAAGPAPRVVWWRRLLAPLAGVAALAVIGVVAFQASQTTKLSPSKADYDVGDLRRESAKAVTETKLAEAMPVAPTQNAFEPAPTAVAEAQPKKKALLEAAQPAGKAQAKENTEELERFDELQGKDAPANKQEQVAKSPVMKELNSVGGALAYGNIGERAAEMPAPPSESAADDFDKGFGDHSTAPAAQMAQAPRQAPSMGLSLGSGRSGAKDGYGSSAGPGQGSSGVSSATLAPPAPSSRAIEHGLESRNASKLDVADREQQSAGELKGLLDQARRVSSSDRVEEIRLAQTIISRGAKGYQRLEALKRLCDAYDALGRDDEATPFCQAVLREFPGSAAAKLVQQRLTRPRPSEYARKKARSSDSSDMALEGDAAKPAAVSPSKASEPAAPAAAH